MSQKQVQSVLGKPHKASPSYKENRSDWYYYHTHKNSDSRKVVNTIRGIANFATLGLLGIGATPAPSSVYTVHFEKGRVIGWD